MEHIISNVFQDKRAEVGIVLCVFRIDVGLVKQQQLAYIDATMRGGDV
jgi:hypothetical protein